LGIHCAKQFKDAATKARSVQRAKKAKEGIKQHKDKADIAKRKEALNKELSPELKAKADAAMKRRRAGSKVDNFTGKTHKELEAGYKKAHGNKTPEMLKRQSGDGKQSTGTKLLKEAARKRELEQKVLKKDAMQRQRRLDKFDKVMK